MRSRLAIACTLLGCSALAATAQAEPGVSARRVVIGMAAPLSGPLAPQGQALRAGMQAALAAANALGGVHGRELQLKVRDDGGEPARALAQAQALLTEDDGVLALTGFVGAATLDAVLPPLLAANVPLVGPVTSAEPALARKPLVLTRAGVREQVSAMLLHIEHLGINEIAVVAQPDALGQAGWDTLHRELTSVATRPVAALRLGADENADAALARSVQSLRASGARAVVLVLEGKAALALVRALRKAGWWPAVYLLHDAWATLAAQGHADELAGAAVAQVLPNVAKQSLPFVAAYRHQAAATGAAPSTTGLEGYLAGRVLVEALKRCPREPLRPCVSEALETREIDLGGYRYQPHAATRRGSRWVEMGLVGRDGKLLL